MFRIDGRLGLVEGFTRDGPALRAAFERATLGNAPAFASTAQAMTGAVDGSRNGGDPLQRGYDRRELRPVHFAGDPEAGRPMDGDGPLAPSTRSPGSPNRRGVWSRSPATAAWCGGARSSCRLPTRAGAS